MKRNYEEVFMKKIEEIQRQKDESFLEKLKEILPDITFEKAKEIYDISISFRQSKCSFVGKAFEETVENFLIDIGIRFEKQVSLNLSKGVISSKRQRPIVDFLIRGWDERIENSIVISCKHSCRERASQDDWSLKTKPRLYVLVYNEDPPKDFVFTASRKLVPLKKLHELKDFLFPKPRFIDLCCGIGSFHLAASELDFECVMACDILKTARQTYKANYDMKPLKDLRDIDYSKFSAEIVFSGNPCQSFSNIGKHGGLEDERGDLFNFIIENIMSLRRFPIFVFENVVGLLSHEEGRTFSFLKEKIEEKGYSVLYKVLLCSDYGIPQNRKRVFIICLLKPFRHNEAKFDEILENAKSKISLTEYLDNGHDFKRETAFTVRCGGVASPIDSKQNWDGYYLTNGETYRLTLEDMKELQGFPKEFELIGTRSEQQKMLGNTIPTNLSTLVCEYLSFVSNI